MEDAVRVHQRAPRVFRCRTLLQASQECGDLRQPLPDHLSRVFASDFLDAFRAGGRIRPLVDNRVVGVAFGFGSDLIKRARRLFGQCHLHVAHGLWRFTSSRVMDEAKPPPSNLIADQTIHGTNTGPRFHKAPSRSVPEGIDMQLRLPTKRGQAVHPRSGAQVVHGCHLRIDAVEHTRPLPSPSWR